MVVCSLMLSGCAIEDHLAEKGSVSADLPEIAASPVLTEEEMRLQELELRYSKGEASLEDYLALADICGEKGWIRRQRDLLEQSYRLFDDEQSLEQLQGITVNLEEEDASVREMAELMLQNLELEEYRDEAVNLISTEEWFTTMMPKLYQGRRSYYLEKQENIALVVWAGYEEDGSAYSNVWYTKEDGQVIQLSYSENTMQMLVCGMKDGIYDGTFESWICDGTEGVICWERGSFVNGNLSGEYTVKIHTGTPEGEVYSLWCNREDMEYTTYTGAFDEQGKTTLEQPESKTLQNLLKDSGCDTGVVYAYNASKEKCLYMGLEEGQDAETYSFESRSMGWKDYPWIETYEVARENDLEENASGEKIPGENAAENTSVQVRIFDGEIQVLLDGVWVNAGGVEELQKQDPFRVYKEEGKNRNNEENIAENPEGSETESDAKDAQTNVNLWKRTGGTIKKATNTTTKPSSKPSNNTTTTPTPAPEPEPNPTPAPSTPSPAPSNPSPAPSTPSPAPSEPAPVTPSEPNGGNDVDIEWTDDIL